MREQIVGAANRLLDKNDCEPTAFAEMAGVVGISQGNFYFISRLMTIFLW
jgi:hypothetical protein